MRYPGSVVKQTVQKILKEDETYVSYYLLDDYSIAFVITKGSFESVKLDVKRKWVEGKIIEIRDQVKYSQEFINLAYQRDGRRFGKVFSRCYRYPGDSNELYQKLFKPLEPYIYTKKVLVSAEGVLYGFPLEALVTFVEYKDKKYSLEKIGLKEILRKPLFYEYEQMKYLGEKYSISYIPTASTLDILRNESRRQRKDVEGVIAFADPVFSRDDKRMKANNVEVFNELTVMLFKRARLVKEWPPKRLPNSSEEAEIFKHHIGKGKVYKGFNATEKNVWQSALEKAKYILFSTHGILGKEEESGSITEPALILTLVENPEDYDGLLEMTEAAGLRLNSDVVILSTCNSAGESGKGGEGFAGMARSFLFAGSQAVVASHWPVDSQATKMLIENYGKYLKTKGRLEALKAARNVVKNEVVEYGKDKKIKISYAHPYFWASFVLLGERGFTSE